MIRRPALALALSSALGACSSGAPELVAAEAPLALPSPQVASVSASPRPRPPLLPESVDVMAVPVERYVRMWERPAAERARFTLDTRNPLGQTSPMLVSGAKRRDGAAWYEVLLPLRPNGSTAWVRAKDVELRRANHRIEVDLSDRVLLHYVDDRLEHELSVGVGTEATPTGTGTFYVWVKVRYASPYQPYGIAALGLSGFSPVLSDWPGGGRMAIHGTSSPTDLGRAVSHGCVRVLNDQLKGLLGVPLGTPVVISA